MTGGDTAGAAEVELKLRIPPACLSRVLASPLLSGRSARTLRLAATYFDTPERHLWHNRIALRVRREGRRWVQAVKGGGSVESGVHVRLEIETPLRSGRPDVSALPRHPLTKILQSRKIAAALAPVLHTEVTRSLRLIEPEPGVLIEAAIDRGVIRSGRRRERVCELELELKSGPVGALFDLAQRLAEQMPLALEWRSKAERGYILSGLAVAAPAKAAPVLLEPDMTVGDAFRAITVAALAQIHANQRGVLESGDPQYLHQMRVGIRRLRSALGLFGELLGDTAVPHVAALRAIAAGLAPARDWDVLVAEVLPQVRAALPDQAAIAAFATVSARRREIARRNAKKSIKTNTYNLSLLALGRWLATLPVAQIAAWQAPARVYAARVLAARHARVCKRGRHLSYRTTAELHRLRIAVKKLRYAAEFFAGLFPAKAMAALQARLTRLQDILGRINDAAAVEPLLAAAIAAAPEVAAAAGSVREWHQSRAAARRAKLQQAWRRFRATRRPWRE